MLFTKKKDISMHHVSTEVLTSPPQRLCYECRDVDVAHGRLEKEHSV